MRRSSRGRRAPVKKYSISHLLARQPKSLQKHQYYPVMMSYFYGSERLQRLRMSRRCYSLLHHAKIAPRNLHHFYRTYRLPKDPFFPLFFMIKREYLQERQRKREERERYIAAQMRSLPEPVLEFIKYLGRLEQQYNRGGRYPIWSEHMFPATKKRVHEYLRFSQQEWIAFFRSYLELLAGRCRALSSETAEKLLACFVLGCLPEGPGSGGRFRWPEAGEISRRYRRLSLEHHPDRGGDGGLFLQLQWAREVLTTGCSSPPHPPRAG